VYQLGVNELSDSVAWPSRDPQWATKVLLLGLISLIPIVGWLNSYGWMLSALDNLRSGTPELPPASIRYIGRGFDLFVVLLVYGLALALIFGALFGAGIGISIRTDGRGSAAGVALILLANAGLVVGVLALTTMIPVIIMATERGGIVGGLNVPALVGMIGRDVNLAFSHGLLALVASLIGSVGALLCLVGQIFTQPYGLAVLAGVVHHYEQSIGSPAASMG
jgi:hypothetical protein